MINNIYPTYNDYLSSVAWKEKCEQIKQQRWFSCDICYSKKHLVVHHKNYSSVGFERPSDLMVVCFNCHHMIHRICEKKGVALFIWFDTAHDFHKVVVKDFPVLEPGVVMLWINDKFSGFKRVLDKEFFEVNRYE